MIRSFRNKDTQSVFLGEFVKDLDGRIQQVMAIKKLRPVHPGDVLLHDFMQPLKLSSYKLAKELGVTAPTVNEIVRRRRAVTAEMALRFSRYFGTTAQLWQNLQSQYDLEIANRKIGKQVKRKIQPLPRPDLSDAPARG